MNELDDLLARLGSALDDGLDVAAPPAADRGRARLIGAIGTAAPRTAGHGRRRLPRPGGRWTGLLVAGLSVAVTLVVLAVALDIGGRRAPASAAVPTVLPFGTSLNPSGPTGVIGSTVRLAAVVPDPEASGPAWGLTTYRVTGGETCFQVGREQAGRIGAVGAYGSFGDDGRFHPFALSDVGFGTCVPNDAHQHAFDNVAYANAPASASGEPCPTFVGAFPRHVPAQVRARLAARTHAADCEPRNQRLVAFGLLGPDATSVTYRTAHGTATTPVHGPDGAYLIVEPVDPAICGLQCGYSRGGARTAMGLPDGLIATITYRDAPPCHGPPLTRNVPRLQRSGDCRDVGYVAPPHPRATEADVASAVHVRLIRGPAQLMAYISWIARQPVTNVNDSTYAIQITYPRHCGAGAEGNSTQSLIRAGTRITRDVEVPSRCPGTYRGTVIYEPSLGPAGQEGSGLVEPGTPGTYLVGRFSIVVH